MGRYEELRASNKRIKMYQEFLNDAIEEFDKSDAAVMARMMDDLDDGNTHNQKLEQARRLAGVYSHDQIDTAIDKARKLAGVRTEQDAARIPHYRSKEA